MKNQQDYIRTARRRLGTTTEELAARLGRSLASVHAWLKPDGNAAHRNMPRSAKLLLDRLLQDAKAKR